MNRIRGTTAIVTGATSGIGEACARLLASHGVHLVLAARREERLTRLARELERHGVEVRTWVLDVRDREGVELFAAGVEAEGVVPYALVNNAGLARGLSTVQNGAVEDWEEMIDTNLKGLLYVSRAILPIMVREDRGHVVNIGSIAGHIVYPMGNVYNATKYGVRALTEGMSIDLVGTRVRVSSVDPGMVETEFSEVRFRGDRERASTVYRGVEPLTPEDVADAVLYVLNTPPHVNVLQMVIMPTAQRNPYVLHRETE